MFSSFLVKLLGACAILSVATAVLRGESVTSLEEFPYLVAILEKGTNICGGSLIRMGLVLTAAHCVYDVPAEDLRVRAATLNRVDRNDKILTANKLDVSKVIPHPYYNRKNQKNDLAILKTKGQFKPSESIDYIDLPPEGTSYNLKMGTVMGWGDLLGGKDATVLQTAKLPIIDYDMCRKFYSSKMIFTTNYCNHHVNKTTSLCNGDSGGPVVIHFKTKRDVLAGVNSWVYEEKKQCSPKYPSVSTNVEKYLNWIQKYVDKFDEANRRSPPRAYYGSWHSSVCPKNRRRNSFIKWNNYRWNYPYYNLLNKLLRSNLI